jgi:hypothetical protein
MVSDEAWSRLHELRLRGMGQPPDDEHTAALMEAGWIARRGSMAVLTPDGRAAHTTWARLPEGSEEEVVTRRAYEQFLELDGSVKALTTEWQLGSGTDEGYNPEEWKLIDRLTTIDERAAPVLLRLGSVVPRFSTYRSRLRAALAHLQEGERSWFSGLECDSYHTVWWHLHEDLLAALGIARSEDPNQ